MRAADAPKQEWLLFLLIGQSNMSGRGVVEEQDKVIHPRVFMLNKELEWVPAQDPMGFDRPDRPMGVGLGSTFGRDLAAKYPDKIIGLVPAAFGGSSIDEWQPGQRHYEDAVKRARQAMRQGRLAGILWHQGERDSNPDISATYSMRFQNMITHLRLDLGVGNVPVVIGELGQFKPAHATINAILAQLPKQVSNSGFVSSQGLTDRGDQTHFDSPSLRSFGHRYAQVWLELAKPVYQETALEQSPRPSSQNR